MKTDSNRRPKQAPSTLPPIFMWLGVTLILAGMAVPVVAQEAAQRCVPREATNTFQGEAVHAPVAEGQCMACHGPHQIGRDRLLRADIPGLCIDCHDQPLKDSAGRTTPSVKALFEAGERAPEDGGLYLHQPFASGDCTCCHDPHASSSPRLLSGPYPWSAYIRYTPERYMCLSCHDEQAFAAPRTLTATKFRNGNLNLHHRHVNRDKGRSCSLCHEYHASRHEALIREEAPFGTQTISISEFERTQTGGSCAPTCHVKADYDRVTPALNAIRVTPREGEEASQTELWLAEYPPEQAQEGKPEGAPAQ